jgi:hypothetical protein
MKPLSSRTHGILDYIVGLLLIAAPFVLGFANGGPAMWVPILLGMATLVYSALTDYEYGMARVVPLPVHLGIDALSGAFLAVSPWLFGFSELVWVPHVLVGAGEIAIAALTRTVPDTSTVRPQVQRPV